MLNPREEFQFVAIFLKMNEFISLNKKEKRVFKYWDNKVNIKTDCDIIFGTKYLTQDEIIYIFSEFKKCIEKYDRKLTDNETNATNLRLIFFKLYAIMETNKTEKEWENIGKITHFDILFNMEYLTNRRIAESIEAFIELLKKDKK